ncbi:MAG: hypothetical protein H5T86_03600 [Armatimonadetes bacterium]|nr:hypothetical protein [Armatimonadota bacterium]
MAIAFGCSGWTVLLVALATPVASDAPDQDLLTQAARLAATVKSLDSRASAFAEVALRYDRAGLEDAERFWRLAWECALAVDDDLARVLARRAVLGRLIQVPARLDDAARQASDILQAAANLPTAMDRALASRELAAVIARAFPDIARKALDQAASAAQTIREPLLKAQSLAETAQVMAETGLIPATDTLSLAIDAWRAAAPSVERDLAAADIVRVAAVVDASLAKAVIEQIGDVQAKANALRAFGEALAEVDVSKALLAVREIGDPTLRALAMAGVSVQAAARDPALAARIARDAVRSTAQAGAPMRGAVLEAAVPALALSAPEEALGLVKDIENDVSRGEALAKAAALLAPVRPALAAEFLQKADQPELAEPVWPEVLYYLAAEDPKRALELADKILERYLRVRAVLRIWDRLSDKGDIRAR